ncbi:MAG: hypothetical protein LIR46_03320 [Bacteroidota bacterium]|nr:hypothetical protein [Bacteroidota bacterium]
MIDVAVKNLMFDSANGVEIFDTENDRVMTKKEVDDKIKEICFDMTGLNEKSTDKQIRNALKSEKSREFFDVVSEIIQVKKVETLEGIDLFNKYVETITVADGNAHEFWSEKETYLQIEKVSGSHHDLITQKLAPGEPYTVPMAYYGIKVGQDIRLFLTGKKSWSAFIDAAVKAFVDFDIEQIYSKFINGATGVALPAGLTDSGALTAANKDDFDHLIEVVEALNGNVPVVIMGTKTALKKMNGLVNNATAVNWMAASQKEAIAHTGILGDYEGNDLLEMPQRYKLTDLSAATGGLIDNTKLFIMPLTEDNKFIKYLDGGEVSLEVTEIGATLNDQQTYEIQTKQGFGAVLSRYFGVWTITA